MDLSPLALVWRSICSYFLDFAFPRYCFTCQRPLARKEVLFCGACRLRLPYLETFCPVCALPLAEGGELCELCRKGRPFDQVHVPFRYTGPIAEGIKQLKYHQALWLAKELARLWQEVSAPLETDLVLPVPLHPARLRQRGFNQSLLVARFLFGRKVQAGLLKRVRPTRPQVELKPRERFQNVKGAFELSQPWRVKDRRVLLFDDVMTTGATIEECARVLKAAGASKVEVALLARAG